MASDEDGGGREDHLEGGWREDRCVLPSGEADWASDPGERDERLGSWQSGSALQQPAQGVFTRKGFRLSKEVYWDFNDTHFTEKLRECEGIDLNRETVRKLRREAGMAPKRRRRGPKHRKRRERKAQEGWMVLWDGSPHPWLGPEHPPCCLMAAIDDATGKLLAARFFPFEGSSGYLWLLKEMVKKYGIPMVIYQDRHGALHRNDNHWSLEEQLAGRQEPTQVGLALESLGIQSISALSPSGQRKGGKTLCHPPGSSGSRTPFKRDCHDGRSQSLPTIDLLQSLQPSLCRQAQRIPKSLERSLEKSGPGSNHQLSLCGNRRQG